MTQSIPAAIEAIEDRTAGLRILTLAPLQPFTFKAGQYVHMHAEGYDPRPYSIANAPGGSALQFHIRNIGKGISAYLCGNTFKRGDMLSIEGPHGVMDAESARGRPVLMVAGGTGIAPMLALAHDIVRRGLSEDGITLIYGVRSETDLYCRKELDILRASGEVALHIVADTHTPDQKLRELGLNLAHHVVYMCGPDPMMLSVHAALLAHLADPSRIFTDADMNHLQRSLT